MAIIGVTDVNVTRQALVASIVQETLKQKSILLPTVTDYSSYAVPGAKSVAISRRAQFAAEDKAEDTDLTGQGLVFVNDTIELSLHKAIYAEAELIAAAQSNVALEAEIIKEMAAELALQVDKDIITKLKLASAAGPDHIVQFANTPTNTLQATDVLEARRLLNVQNISQEDRFMLVSPDQEKALLSISSFIEVDKYGPNAAIAKGELGSIYGFRVLMHTGLSAAEAIFWNKMAVGFASQVNPEFKTDENLKGVKKEYLLHHLYGVKELQAGKAQVFFNATGA